MARLIVVTRAGVADFLGYYDSRATDKQGHQPRPISFPSSFGRAMSSEAFHTVSLRLPR
jgi:hypothetical protein